MRRQTRQRAAILKCLLSAKRPLGVEEILDLSEKEIPRINLSTVYRNLKILVDEGRLAIVDLPGGQSRYELMEMDHHHYFLCESCNRVFSTPGCPQGLSDLIPKGFSLRGHSIILNGQCVDCLGN